MSKVLESLKIEDAADIAAAAGLSDNRSAAFVFADGSATWPEAYSADIDAALKTDWRGAASRSVIARSIKAHASQRINAVLKDHATQINISAYGTVLVAKSVTSTLTEKEQEEIDILIACQKWVSDVLAKSRELAKAGDRTYELEVHWPDPPAGIAEIIEAL